MLKPENKNTESTVHEKRYAQINFPNKKITSLLLEGLCLPLPRKYVTRPLYVSLLFYKYGNMMCLFIKYLSSYV